MMDRPPVRVTLDGRSEWPQNSEANARQVYPELQAHPHVFEWIRYMSDRAGLARPPDVVIVESVGISHNRNPNAFAAKMPDTGRGTMMPSITIVSSLLREVSPNALNGIMGHELGHHVAGHTKMQGKARRAFNAALAVSAPFIANWLSRRREREADALGIRLLGDASGTVESSSIFARKGAPAGTSHPSHGARIMAALHQAGAASAFIGQSLPVELGEIKNKAREEPLPPPPRGKHRARHRKP